MIDHFTLSVSDLDKSRAFYQRVLAPLGYSVRMEFPQYVGMGDKKKPYLWLKQAHPVSTPMHIAFVAANREQVDGFHRAALEAGARDDGAPGVREHYHPHYYAAFVIDPIEGHPLEAVCHLAPGQLAADVAPVKAAAAKSKKAPLKKRASKAPSKRAAKKPKRRRG